jgi:hypothetical protein
MYTVFGLTVHFTFELHDGAHEHKSFDWINKHFYTMYVKVSTNYNSTKLTL